MLERIAGVFFIGCKKWQKQIATIFLAVALILTGSLFALNQPASAVSLPDPGSSFLPDPGSSGLPDPGSSALPDPSAPSSSGDGSAESSNCDKEIGAIGWAICPGTGAIAKAIDAVYKVIVDLIKVQPLSTDQTSATYIVWEYARNITNIVFIIFIVIIIISQVTGFGINNYGIKKSLPRIIIAAVLVNLSFIICTLAVDIGNILGYSVHNFFTGIATTLANTGTSEAVTGVSISWDVVVGSVLAGIPIAGIAGLAAVGGFASLIWIVIPAVLGALVAVLAAFLTLAARQALITILVMISPLAIVAYLLPNTENLFTKWRELLMKLLVFFPMFSLLFGASQLAGWAIVASGKENGWMLILGMAVQIFPLIFTPTLLKMSGTVLGKINDFARRPFAPAQKALKDLSAEQRRYHSARHMMGNTPSASIRRFMYNRRIQREEDTARYEATTKLRGQAFSASSIYDRNGKLTSRGERLYAMQNDELESQNTIKKIATDMDEGYDASGFGKDKRIRSQAQHDRLNRVNKKLVSSVDTMHFQNARAESVKLANLESHAERVDEARELEALTTRVGRTSDENARLRQLQTSDNIGKLQEIKSTSGALGESGINNIIASAIAMKTKADKEAKGNYNTLFEQTARTKEIFNRYIQSIQSGNYNEMEAAIENLALRGDFNLIVDGLMEHGTAANLDLKMQKHLADTLIRYKADSAPLSTYAKALNIRRGKAAAGQPINEFISFEDYATGKLQAGDSRDIAESLTMTRLLGDIADPAVAATQDRNTFDFILDMAKNNKLKIDPSNPESILGFKLKQLRSAASSGRMDGEQLANLNALITGGFSSLKLPTDPTDPTYAKQLRKYHETKAFVDNNRALIEKNVENYLRYLSASQLASMKESTFVSLRDTLNYVKGTTGTQSIKPLLSTAIDTISKPSAATMRGSMNTNIRDMLNIQP